MSEKRKQRRPLSLQLRLLVLAALLLMVSLGLVGVALDAAFHRSSEAGLQARMESLVYLVLAAIEVSDDGGFQVEDEPGDPRLGQPGSGFYASALGDRGRWMSPSSLAVSLPGLPVINAGEQHFETAGADSAFYTLQYGVSWELSNGSMLPLSVNIYVDPQVLQPELKAFRNGLWKSLGTAGLILVLAQVVLLALGLKPLRRITEHIADLESGESDRLEGDYPRELETLKRNINHLLDTEKANQERYRNALDSLAHSLKTPLSVIGASLPADNSAKNAAIEHSVGDMQRLIATRLQRAAISTRRSMAQAVEVEPQVERVLQSLKRVYSHKMISTDVNITPGLTFFGEQRDLLEVAGNLLDNACKYGEGRVRISACGLDAQDPRAGISMVVEDNGPGIADHERESLLQRGVRGDERVEGHGLGLAIVLELVSAYDGDIEIGQSDLGGARISVRLRSTHVTTA